MASDNLEVRGLSTYDDFISEDDALRIINKIDECKWLSGENALKRRTQHYGYEYDYKTRSASMLKVVEPIPEFLIGVCDKLKVLGVIPDQLIINEYLPGQGIAAHIDQSIIFGDTVISVALCGECIMTFGKGKSKVDLLFKERMAVVLQGDARYKWTHSIPARKKDGSKPRTRRISLTFRTIKTHT